MFDQSQKPFGFSGRPLIALLFWVAPGVLGFQLGLWLHLNEIVAYAISAALVGFVGYVWYRMEKPTTPPSDIEEK